MPRHKISRVVAPPSEPIEVTVCRCREEIRVVELENAIRQYCRWMIEAYTDDQGKNEGLGLL